jgi:uncharacterized membrane protein YeiB
MFQINRMLQQLLFIDIYYHYKGQLWKGLERTTLDFFSICIIVIVLDF